MSGSSATARAHPNIALVKYWGKRDAHRILPHQSSLSVTLAPLEVVTTVQFGAPEDGVTLHGAPARGKERSRVLSLLERVRQQTERPLGPVRVDSRGNFPMAAGLASSAAGFAALALAARAAAGLSTLPAEVSRLAREGSGSACRSIQGGVCIWHRGTRADGEDSIATQAFGESHWPELRLLAAVLSRSEKEVSSRDGMAQTVETSPYYPAWVEDAEAEIARATAAIARRDVEALGALSERNAWRMRHGLRRRPAALLPLALDPGAHSHPPPPAARGIGVVHPRRRSIGAAPLASRVQWSGWPAGRSGGGGALPSRRRCIEGLNRCKLPLRPGKLFPQRVTPSSGRDGPPGGGGPDLGLRRSRDDREVHLVLAEGRLEGTLTPLGVRWKDAPSPPFAFAASALDLVVRAQARETLGFSLALSPTPVGPEGLKLGLGSSARAVVLAVEAAARLLEVRSPLALAMLAHAEVQGGRGSGGDVAACSVGGLLRYRRWPVERVTAAPALALGLGAAGAPDVVRLGTTALPALYAFSGQSASTPGMIARVEAALSGEARQRFVEDSDALGQELEDGLRASRFAQVDEACRGLQHTLSALPGVSTPAMERIVALAHASGCTGKVSGAGGGDGCAPFAPDEARGAAPPATPTGASGGPRAEV